ncbi:HAD family hydrolase [Gracilibacillus timonensis]|uniref:HAD family hydrolase n=1 Tax=Gracilibacillus timonensis TaxID=1816696 RepID=UPI00082403B4|nr:HAD family hydrolase [Gracilibacillus timonensis]
MIKTALFDFDGTLANTLPLCFEAFQNVFEKFDNRSLSDEEIIEMFGPSETGIIRENLRHKNKQEAIELYYQTYREKHGYYVKENDEILDMIVYLKEKNVQVGIVTGKARRSLDLSLESLGMAELFDVTITGDDVIHPKPHPEGVVKAMSLLGAKRAETIFIGDSEADIEAGDRANVYTAGVTWLPDYDPNRFPDKTNDMFDTVYELKRMIEG